MKIKPLLDNILIEPTPQKEKTKSGILLLNMTEEENSGQEGKVIAIGPGKKDEAGQIIPIEVKKGDIVLFTKYSVNEIKVEDKKYLMTEQKYILAILE